MRLKYLAPLTTTLLVGCMATRPASTGSLRTHIEGAGPATVVFEAGLGDTLDVWKNVQSSIAQSCARTLSYNRAGYPGSGKATGTRDAQTIVSELRVQLAAQGLAPPYVLVGHSLGGLYMQYFARNYPQEVSGLVLVDATHWEQRERIRQDSPATDATLRAVALLMPGNMRRELTDSEQAGKQVHDSPAAAVPTIVLSSTRARPGETPGFRALAARLQGEIAADFPSAKRIDVEGATHYIQRDRPQAVIQAVRELARCAGGE